MNEIDQAATVDPAALTEAEYDAYTHLCAVFGDTLSIVDVRIS